LAAKVNWFGLAGGISAVFLIVISIFVPWWRLMIGDNIVTANVSPVYTNFDFKGSSFTIPLLFALNIGCIILLAVGGIVILVYSLKPDASYSKVLLKSGYWQPLFAVIVFIVGLVVMTFVVRSVWSIDVPLMGAGLTTLPANLTQGATVNVLMEAGFQWPFILALAAAAFCIAAKLYDKKMVSPKAV